MKSWVDFCEIWRHADYELENRWLLEMTNKICWLFWKLFSTMDYNVSKGFWDKIYINYE